MLLPGVMILGWTEVVVVDHVQVSLLFFSACHVVCSRLCCYNYVFTLNGKAAELCLCVWFSCVSGQ